MSFKVIVASKNPVKVQATRQGFEQMFPGDSFEMIPVSVSSGVSDQPSTDRETYEGAHNRAFRASKKYPDADFWVGIEGGIESFANEMEAFAWIVIKSLTKTGKAKTATFFLPREVIELIVAGRELGEADDIVFGESNTKQKIGAVGLLTDNTLNRSAYYTQAVILALIPFKKPHLY